MTDDPAGHTPNDLPPDRSTPGRDAPGRDAPQDPSSAAGTSTRGDSADGSSRPDADDALLPAPWWRYAKHLAIGAASLVGGFYATCTLALIAYAFVPPPVTGVQLQRHVAHWGDGTPYTVRYEPVRLADVAPALPAAVVAAEDTRFYQHAGIDWTAIQRAVEENMEQGEIRRGGSTITQQLVKNLFLTTHSTYLRKALEVPLTGLAELLLSKDRILELYLSVVEWGPGIFGAEAAAQYHYGVSARALSRWQAAALAACLPNPRVRHPQVMDRYTRIILGRMDGPSSAPSESSSSPSASEALAPDSSTVASVSSDTTSPGGSDSLDVAPARQARPDSMGIDTPPARLSPPQPAASDSTAPGSPPAASPSSDSTATDSTDARRD